MEKKENQEKGVAGLRPPKRSVGGVRFYETWAELIVDMWFHRVVAVASLFLFFVILFWALKVLTRPPVVIRVDRLGNPQIVQDARSEGSIAPEEIQNFVTYFIEYWRGWDYYKYDDNFKRVFEKQMTGELANKLNTYLRENRVIEKIKQEKLKYKVMASSIVIKSRDKNYVVVEVAGTREEGSYDGAVTVGKKDVRFLATIVLKVVPRTVSPWGLLAQDYEEKVFD